MKIILSVKKTLHYKNYITVKAQVKCPISTTAPVYTGGKDFTGIQWTPWICQCISDQCIVPSTANFIIFSNVSTRYLFTDDISVVHIYSQRVSVHSCPQSLRSRPQWSPDEQSPSEFSSHQHLQLVLPPAGLLLKRFSHKHYKWIAKMVQLGDLAIFW